LIAIQDRSLSKSQADKQELPSNNTFHVHGFRKIVVEVFHLVGFGRTATILASKCTLPKISCISRWRISNAAISIARGNTYRSYLFSARDILWSGIRWFGWYTNEHIHSTGIPIRRRHDQRP